jgi:molybdopterin molybdotransferase
MTLESCVIAEKKPLLSVNEAKQRIYNAILPLVASEILPLKNAFGRILAKTVFSPINLPIACNSAMDGYAFSSEFFAEKLTCVGVSWAGKPFANELKSGECVRIFTGAVLPENTDSVVMQENVTVDRSQITFSTDIKLKENVREIGEDVKISDVLCEAGKTLSAIDLGLLASAGVEKVTVIRKVKIAYFSTGDELVGLGENLEIGKIYDSNRYSLHGLLQNPCYEIFDGGVIADNKEILKNTLQEAAKNFDVIITTGGASVGDADFVKEALDELGEVNFWKMAMKPGKPLAFGKIGVCYFFGLPGNPVAVTTTFDVIIKSALARLSGANFSKPFEIRAICASELKKSRGRQEFQRGILRQDNTGKFHVFTTGNQGSHILSSASSANCYIVLDADCTGVEIGEFVRVMPFSL